MAESSKAAYFERGQTTIIKSFKVDAKGGLFEIGNLGTPIDGTVIEIPNGALEEEVTMSVGYNNGVLLNLRAGEDSGIVGVLSTTSRLLSFEKPVTIKFRFDPSIINPETTIVGFEIDKQGRLHPLNLWSVDKKNGVGSFFTFYAPIMFTWIYVF